MKYLIVLAGGLADEGIADLGGRTPLEAAHTPVLDEMARNGKLARVTTLPDDLPASEEVALLSCLGYDPRKYFAGEAGLAAADAAGAPLEGFTPFLHHFVTEADNRIRDPSAGHVTVRESRLLLDALREEMKEDQVHFHVGRGYTGLTWLRLSGPTLPSCTAPEAAWDRDLEKTLPKGDSSDLVREVIALSREILSEHEVNRVRADLGENPANLLWPWGPGRTPTLPSFHAQFSVYGALLADMPSARGLGRLAGLAVADPVAAAETVVEGTYDAAVRRAIDALAQTDAAILHVSATTEASLSGDLQVKVGAIRDLDAQVLAPLFRFVTENPFVRLLFLPTHAVSVVHRRRLRNPVPALLFGSGLESVRHSACTESALESAEITVERGHELMAYFLRV